MLKDAKMCPLYICMLIIGISEGKEKQGQEGRKKKCIKDP